MTIHLLAERHRASSVIAGNDPRRIEWVQAQGLRTFIATARRLRVPTLHDSLDVAGGIVCIFAKGSPLNVARGVAVGEPIDDDGFASMEAFFARHGEVFKVETSPATHPTLRALLAARGARIEARIPIYARDLREDPAGPSAGDPEPRLGISCVDESTAVIFDDVVGRGFSEGMPPPEMFRDIGPVRFAIPRGANYLASVDGAPAGGGRVSWVDVPRERGGGRVAHLSGASTLPEFRGKGVQTALLATRVARAAAAGCDTACMGCRPDSASERNILRARFLRAYDVDVVVVPEK